MSYTYIINNLVTPLNTMTYYLFHVLGLMELSDLANVMEIKRQT